MDATTTPPAAAWEPIAGLTPFAGNPRRNERSVPVVADSIRRFGFGAPVVVRASTGDVLAGHTRIAAAKVLAERWAKATTRERSTWHPDAVRVAELAEVCPGLDTAAAVAALRSRSPRTAVVLSLGAKGLLADTPDGVWRARPTRPLTGNPTGAGDAAVAALALLGGGD